MCLGLFIFWPLRKSNMVSTNSSGKGVRGRSFKSPKRGVSSRGRLIKSSTHLAAKASITRIAPTPHKSGSVSPRRASRTIGEGEAASARAPVHAAVATAPGVEGDAKV